MIHFIGRDVLLEIQDADGNWHPLGVARGFDQEEPKRDEFLEPGARVTPNEAFVSVKFLRALRNANERVNLPTGPDTRGNQTQGPRGRWGGLK